MSMYSLTDMTGRTASEQRTVVIGTVEMNRQVWIILLCGLVPAIFVTGVLWLFVGQLAIVAMVVVEFAALWLVYRRSSKGLKLRTYRSTWDRHRGKDSMWMMCRLQVNPTETDYVELVDNTIVYGAPESEQQLSYLERLANQATVSPPASPPQQATPVSRTPREAFRRLPSAAIGREVDPDAPSVQALLSSTAPPPPARSAHVTGQPVPAIPPPPPLAERNPEQ